MGFIMEGAKEITPGERILQLRTERHYTREQLAYMADISGKFLYEIENNKKGFSAVTLLKLSKALDVSLDYIMMGNSAHKPENEIVATLERFNPNVLDNIERLLKIAYELTKGNK
ncbi:MAG: helix-turn-helix domain-containing protein [Lachnospiraceae bacterium]